MSYHTNPVATNLPRLGARSVGSLGAFQRPPMLHAFAPHASKETMARAKAVQRERRRAATTAVHGLGVFQKPPAIHAVPVYRGPATPPSAPAQASMFGMSRTKWLLAGGVAVLVGYLVLR